MRNSLLLGVLTLVQIALGTPLFVGLEGIVADFAYNLSHEPGVAPV